MKTSARNVFRGKIGAIRTAGLSAEIALELGGGDRLVAVIARERAEALELAEGKEVVAMVKAPWVVVAAGGVTRGLSARNLLAGSVTSLTRGAVNAEVVIALPGGSEVTATITREAATELGLTPGAPACAVIQASDVVLATPA